MQQIFARLKRTPADDAMGAQNLSAEVERLTALNQALIAQVATLQARVTELELQQPRRPSTSPMRSEVVAKALQQMNEELPAQISSTPRRGLDLALESAGELERKRIHEISIPSDDEFEMKPFDGAGKRKNQAKPVAELEKTVEHRPMSKTAKIPEIRSTESLQRGDMRGEAKSSLVVTKSVQKDPRTPPHVQKPPQIRPKTPPTVRKPTKIPIQTSIIQTRDSDGVIVFKASIK